MRFIPASEFENSDLVFRPIEEFEKQPSPESAQPPVSREEPGLIARAIDAVKGTVSSIPAAIAEKFTPYKSVLETYQPTAAEQQAEIDKRLSYGAGPISQATVAKADAMRMGRVPVEAGPALTVARAREAAGEKTFKQLVESLPTPEGFTPADADTIRRNQFAEENPLLGSMASGAAGMISGTLNAPSVAADSFNQTFVNPLLQAAGLKPLDRVPTAIGTEYLAKTAADFMPTIGKRSMEGAWKNDEFSPWLMSKLAANSPQIAMQLAAAFAPPLRAVLLPSMGATAAGQSYAQGDDSRVAVAKGLLEYGTEKLPLQAFDKIGDVLKGLSPAKTNAIMAVAGQRVLQAGGAVTANALTNAIEETAAQFGGNVLDKYFQGKDIELSKGLGEAAVVGAAVGKVMSAPQLAATLSGAYDPNVQIAKAMSENVAGAQWIAPATEVARDRLSPYSAGPNVLKVDNLPIPQAPTSLQLGQAFLAPVDTTAINQAGSVDEAITAAQTAAGEVGQVGPAPALPTPGLAELPPIAPISAAATGPGMPAMPTVPGMPAMPAITPVAPVTTPAAAELPVVPGLPAAPALATPAAPVVDELGRIEPTLEPFAETPAAAPVAAVNPVTEQQFGLDKLRMKAPRPQRIQGTPVAQLTDDQLTTIAGDETVPAITRRSAAVELQARGAETTLATPAAPAAPTMAGNAEFPGQPSPAMGQPMAQGGATPALGGVAPGAPQLAQQPAAGLQQPGALDTAEGAQAVGLPQPLKLAKPASARNIGRTLKTVRTEMGVDAEVYDEPLTEAQQAASALGRVMGKTVTFLKAGPGQLANGFVIPSISTNDVYIASDADAPVLGVAVHEITHLLPEPVKTKLNAGLRALFNDNYLPEWAAKRGLDINDTALIDEEIPAYISQAISERPDFWQDLRAKMGDGDFAEVARVILAKLNDFLAGTDREYGQDFLDRYVTDVAKARDLLSTAYADAMKAQGKPVPKAARGGIQATERIQPERQQEGRVGQVDTHVLNVARGERATAERTTVNAEEKAIIRQAAQKMKLSNAEVEQMVRDHKAAHPADVGWAQLTLTGVKIDEDTGKGELQYQVIPYGFNAGANGKALEPNTPEYEAKVANLAQAMLREVRGVFARAQNGDTAAKNIIAQSGWYKEMRTRLRQEFGGLGDLFADLLGATSPNTPVRTNWDNSVEALRLATTGAFDKLLPQWIAYFDNLDQAETQFRAVFDGMLKTGMTKAEIKRSPEFQEQQQLVRAARNFPDELLPLKSNGKKFGFNGFNVARAMVDLWRVVKNADPDIGRGGTAPKAINFSGNLIGFRSRATIDVWAARMLQRLAGGLRIPSMAESGVTGEALESGRNTLQFGLGQDVFSAAVKLIRNDPVLSQDPVLRRINDDDLQALVWFIEKEVWTKGNWTSAAGEGGSFEFEADLAGVSDRERVNELRKVADSSVASTKEQRDQAELDIQRLTQEIAALPEIAKANAKLEANAQRMAADKAAPKAEKLTKLQKEAIRLENTAAQAAKKKAKTGKAYKALESQLNKAKAVLKKPTTEERRNLRTGALQELGKIARPVDRFTVGLSIQKGAEQGVEPTPPTDSAMAELAQKIADAVVAGDPGATVVGLKSIATEGRYGAPERALDLEAITRAGFDPRPLAVATFDAADQADQDAAFVARVLRPNELFDPQMHRPGVEIYFRDMNQAAEAARMMAGIAGIRVGKTTEFGPGYFEIGGYTVIVDGRPTAEAKAGAMGKPVGMRVLYMPEFEARYGIDPRLENATDEELAGIIEDRADTLGDFADAVLRQFDGVSFAGRFNYEVDTRFAGEYQGAIDAYTNRTTDERAGQGGETPWGGRSIRESIAAATGQLPVNANQPGTELPGGDRSETKLSQGRPGKPTVQASNRVKSAEAIFKDLDGRGPAKTRAEKALRTRPDADQVRFIQDNFLDILVELEDSGRIKINCK